jgi:hypothetical protein
MARNVGWEFPRNALLKEKVGSAYMHVGRKAVNMDVFAQCIAYCSEDHALVMGHIGPNC